MGNICPISGCGGTIVLINEDRVLQCSVCKTFFPKDSGEMEEIKKES